MLETYRGGYRKALLDMKNLLESHSEALSFYKLLNKKSNREMQSLLSAMLDNTDLVMAYGENVVIVKGFDGKFIIKSNDTV